MGIEGKTTRLELGWTEIELEVEVAAVPAEAYRAFVDDIARWWGQDWLMGGGKTTGLRLEDVPGGRLLEEWGGEDGAIWAFVIQVERGRMIRLGIPEGAGWSGPGFIQVRFADGKAAGTTVRLSHESAQTYAEGAHEGYQAGWTSLLMDRYAAYVAGEQVERAVDGSVKG